MTDRDESKMGATALQGEAKRFAMALQITDSANIAEELAARYRLLLDNSGFPVSYMDRDGQFLYVTNKGATNLGDSPENVAGRTVYDYFPAQDADEYVRRFREVIDNDRELTFEDEVRLPDGTRWYWSILHPLKNSSGEILGVQIVSHDLTERMTAEAALEERLRFERLIAKLASGFVSLSMPEVSAAVDAALKKIGIYMAVDRVLLFQFSDDYQILDCTHEWHRSGMESAMPRLQGNTNSQVPWTFHKLLLGEIIAIPNTNELPETARAEREIYQKHGVRSTIAAPIRIVGRTVGALCFDCLGAEREWSDVISQRVTLLGQMIFNSRERARIEQELKESRQLVHAATDASPHVTYVLDFINLKCIFISAQVKEELGYTPEEIYAMGASLVTDNLHPDDMSRLGELLERWIHVRDEDILETEIRLRHADGSWRTCISRDRVLKRAPEGHVTQTIGSMRDITEQKRADEELQSHREKLIHVARLSTMGEMVAGIAHELGQPLYSILNFAKASHNVLNEYDDPRLEEARQWNDQVVQSAARAGEIIRRLRDFSRRSTPKREDLDIRAVVEEAVQLLAYETRRLAIHTDHDVTGEPLVVRADRVQLLQILVNLIQNAIEAMTETTCDVRKLTIRAEPCSGRVEVSVVDRGHGLPDSTTPIFDAFVTTKEDGMGMGLAICKTLVESHDGKLDCETNEDGGATFRLILPLAVGVEPDGE
ncbi:MAG: PAS domain-containing protein [Planctomycetes bacterium]|nr:PAS domain-containing protein [Planctomycetota bacterium]